MRTKLPKELRYLSSVLSDLDDQDALSENTDIGELREALLERIGGMPEEKAQKRLDDDLERLELWMEDTDDDVSAAHFILRYMMKPGLARELLEARAAEDAAAERKSKTDNGGDAS